MYRPFFGLTAHPFGPTADPRFLYLTPQVREVLSCLQFGIASRKGFVVVTGEAGTGKTTLLKTVLGTFVKSRVSTAFVYNPRLEILDFLEYVLTDFGLTPTARTKSGMLLQLNSWLIERYKRAEVCVIVIDEAHSLSAEMLEEIRLLTNLETSSEKLLQIVLCGLPELLDELRYPSIHQRVALWCQTAPLTREQTQEYIAERLRIAGATQPVFTLEATDAAYRFSMGVPRVINLICDHALVDAYAQQIKPIHASVIVTVCKDLDLVRTPQSYKSTTDPQKAPWADFTPRPAAEPPKERGL
jgi:type II secretory pathway predicted ATPase ExeA